MREHDVSERDTSILNRLEESLAQYLINPDDEEFLKFLMLGKQMSLELEIEEALASKNVAEKDWLNVAPFGEIFDEIFFTRLMTKNGGIVTMDDDIEEVKDRKEGKPGVNYRHLASIIEIIIIEIKRLEARKDYASRYFKDIDIARALGEQISRELIILDKLLTFCRVLIRGYPVVSRDRPVSVKGTGDQFVTSSRSSSSSSSSSSSWPYLEPFFREPHESGPGSGPIFPEGSAK
jgi:hypothetical protein